MRDNARELQELPLEYNSARAGRFGPCHKRKETQGFCLAPTILWIVRVQNEVLRFGVLDAPGLLASLFTCRSGGTL